MMQTRKSLDTVDSGPAWDEDKQRKNRLLGLDRNQDQLEMALLACRLLVAAYQVGEQRGGSVDWDDVDAAYNAACGALKL